MSSQSVPIHRTNTKTTSSTNKNEIWFNAFDYAPGEDANIRWLSRPNQQLIQGKYSRDTEKFRITFDVENFKPEQIKIYIQNRKLTISGVYEEHSEGRHMQKTFERTFDIPANADVSSMASFITAAHMLVVEIPLTTSTQVDHLNVGSNQNEQRRLSFSLDKFNTSANQGLSSISNDSSSLSTPAQQVRRTSVTKTTTITSTTGSSGLSPELSELLKQAEAATGSTTQTHTTHTTERHLSNASNQQTSITQPQTSSSTTSNKQTTLTASNLENLPVEIPPELLTSGGTITIQKRKVSVTRGTDGSTDQATSAPTTHGNNTQSSSTTTTNTTHNTNQTVSVPVNRSDSNTHSTSSTTTNTTNNTNQTVSVPINRSDSNTQSTSSTTTNTTGNTNQTVSIPINRNDNTQSTSSTTQNTSSNTLNQQQSNTMQRHSSQTSSSSNQRQMYTLEEFLQNKTWNPSIIDGSDGKKILYMRLQMKPGTTLDQIKISLNDYDFRVEVNNKALTEGGRYMSEHSYRQVTLFPTCEIDQLKTEFKADGFLHIQVPIKL